jgi:hypothetical protein
MTSLTYDVARSLAKQWRPGDEVVVTRLDHDANIRPWITAAQRAGATVRWVGFDRETAELPVAAVEQQLTSHTRLVAVTGASNLLGTRPDVAGITAAAHAVGALAYVDGVHLTPHSAVDVAQLGADFYACSPYKIFGPHHGVLAAQPGLLETIHPDKLLPASDSVPERFELGTLPYELLAGTTAAIDFIAGMASTAPDRRTRILESMSAAAEHEDRCSAACSRGCPRSGRSSSTARRSGGRRPPSSRSRAELRARCTSTSQPGASTRPPAASTRSRPPAGSGSATPAPYGRAWRPTPTTRTWTGCSRASGARPMSRGVLVTGASRGIGRAIARAFAEAGDRVAVHHGSSPDLAEGVRGQLPGEGHVVVQADMGDAGAVQRQWTGPPSSWAA